MARSSKAALHRLAQEVRRELNLDDYEPFDMRLWAEEYGVPIVSAAEVGASAAAMNHITSKAPHVWSAALIQDGMGHVIVYNPAHTRVRVRSNLAHEVGHIVAEHALEPTWLDQDGGCTATNKAQELEAAELAGALLIPQPMAQRAAMRQERAEVIADRYQVSIEMASWRMRMSGGAHIAARRKARQRAASNT